MGIHNYYEWYLILIVVDAYTYLLFLYDTLISAMVDLDLDTVDGNFPSGLESKPTLSTVKIEQREPKMEMKIEVIFFFISNLTFLILKKYILFFKF